MRRLLLAALIVSPLLGLLQAARAQDEPRAVLARAIQAHGGAERLARLGCVHLTTKGVLHLGSGQAPFVAETYAQLPGRLKNVLTCALQGKEHKLTQIINCERIALLVDGQAQELKDSATTELREVLYAERVHTLTPLLADRDVELLPAGEGKVNGRPTIGITVRARGHKDVGLHFDRGTGLLVRTERRTIDLATLKEVVQEEYYGEYQAIDELQRPMKVVVLKDGKTFMEGEVLAVKYLERLDEAVFNLP